MKREDFKEISEKHIETVRKIIELKGSCAGIKCDDCPFSHDSSTLIINTCADLYATGSSVVAATDEKLLQSANNFLEMCRETGALIGEGTVAGDKIKSPSHYKLEGLNCETIDVVKARLGKEGFKAFCIGNVIKYVLRAEKKNGLEDYKKSRQYLDWIIEGGEHD